MTDAKMFGIYSAEADARFGHVIYSTPDGGTVRCTCIHSEPDWDGYTWADKQPVGEVVEMVGASEKHRRRFMPEGQS